MPLDAAAVRVGPGLLRIAPIGSTVPPDLETPWAVAWTLLGYTAEGSNFVFNNTFEDVMVAEELEPIHILQTARQIDINTQLAEITARNMEIAFNGGTIIDGGTEISFEPPPAGEYTAAMLGWEATDGLERWIFRRVIQVGSVDIPRRKAPDKAVLPMSFRATKPTGEQAFIAYFDQDYVGS